MRILVYNAGVQGSLYGARLHEAGHDVELLEDVGTKLDTSAFDNVRQLNAMHKKNAELLR